MTNKIGGTGDVSKDFITPPSKKLPKKESDAQQISKNILNSDDIPSCDISKLSLSPQTDTSKENEKNITVQKMTKEIRGCFVIIGFESLI